MSYYPSDEERILEQDAREMGESDERLKEIAESEQAHHEAAYDDFDDYQDREDDDFDFCPSCGFELSMRRTCAVCDEDEDGDYY